MSTFCHAPQKIALLLHKMENGPYSLSETVCSTYKNFVHTGVDPTQRQAFSSLEALVRCEWTLAEPMEPWCVFEAYENEHSKPQRSHKCWKWHVISTCAIYTNIAVPLLSYNRRKKDAPTTKELWSKMALFKWVWQSLKLLPRPWPCTSLKSDIGAFQWGTVWHCTSKGCRITGRRSLNN